MSDEPQPTPPDLPPAPVLRTATHDGGATLLTWLTVAVCALTFAVHLPVFRAEAVYFDDGMYLTENRLVQNPSWESVQTFFSEVRNPSTVRGYYQPLAMTSLMVDVALGGDADNLTPFHVTSLTLHVANVALVTVLLYLLFKNAWVAALTGLLFGVHPLTVESIPWIAERKTLLAGFFSFACLLAYVVYVDRRSWLAYGVSLLMLVLALLSKPTSVPLPAVLLLLDFWPLRRLNWRAVVEKVPFLVVAGGAAVITVISQETAADTIAPGEREQGWFDVLLIIFHNIVFYLWKIVWPADLSSNYGFPQPFTWQQPRVLAGIIGTAVLIPLLLISLRWTRAALTGWLIFFVAIFPTMGVIGFTNVIASHKYAYIPAVGLLMILAWALTWLWQTAGVRSGALALRGALVAGVLVLAGLEGWAAVAQHRTWRDTETLYRAMLDHPDPGDAYALHSGLGDVLIARGELDEGLRYLEQSLELNPDYYVAQNNMGLALVKQAERLVTEKQNEAALAALQQAKRHFEKSVELKPGATAYANLGRLARYLGKPDEAETYLEQALELDPASYESYNALAVLKAMRGDLAAAEANFRKAIEVNPRFVAAYVGLARALRVQQELSEAVRVCQDALQIDPDNRSVQAELNAARAALEQQELPAP